MLYKVWLHLDQRPKYIALWDFTIIYPTYRGQLDHPLNKLNPFNPRSCSSGQALKVGILRDWHRKENGLISVNSIFRIFATPLLIRKKCTGNKNLQNFSTGAKIWTSISYNPLANNKRNAQGMSLVSFSDNLGQITFYKKYQLQWQNISKESGRIR